MKRTAILGTCLTMGIVMTGCEKTHTNHIVPVGMPGSASGQRDPAVSARVRTEAGKILNKSPDSIKETDGFVRELGADSLDTVEIVMATEEAFGIAIADEDAVKLITVGDLIDFVSARIKGDPVAPGKAVPPAVPETSTFGIQHVTEVPPELSHYICDRVLPSELYRMHPKLSLDDIFSLRPLMDKKGDRGPIGRDYFDPIVGDYLYNHFCVQTDRNGINNISFRFSFKSPPAKQVDQTVLWLLTLFGEPSEAFARDLSPSQAGDELFALIWNHRTAMVALSFHVGSGVHSSLYVCRPGTKAKDIFSLKNRTDLKTNSKFIQEYVHNWSVTIAKLSDMEPTRPSQAVESSFDD